MQIKSTFRHILSTNCRQRRTPAATAHDYEKHRAAARARRPGVNGGSAPDGLRVIKKICPVLEGGAGGMSPRKRSRTVGQSMLDSMWQT